MSRDWAYERDQRVAFIQSVLKSSGAKGIVFGNSGGKDCCLVGILCRLATPNVTGRTTGRSFGRTVSQVSSVGGAAIRRTSLASRSRRSAGLAPRVSR